MPTPIRTFVPGQCPACGETVITKDPAGRLVAPQHNYGQVYIVFEQGGQDSRMKVPVCKTCIPTANATQIYQSLLQANDPAALYYHDLGLTPTRVEVVRD